MRLGVIPPIALLAASLLLVGPASGQDYQALVRKHGQRGGARLWLQQATRNALQLPPDKAQQFLHLKQRLEALLKAPARSYGFGRSRSFGMRWNPNEATNLVKQMQRLAQPQTFDSLLRQYGQENGSRQWIELMARRAQNIDPSVQRKFYQLKQRYDSVLNSSRRGFGGFGQRRRYFVLNLNRLNPIRQQIEKLMGSVKVSVVPKYEWLAARYGGNPRQAANEWLRKLDIAARLLPPAPQRKYYQLRQQIQRLTQRSSFGGFGRRRYTPPFDQRRFQPLRAQVEKLFADQAQGGTPPKKAGAAAPAKAKEVVVVKPADKVVKKEIGQVNLKAAVKKALSKVESQTDDPVWRKYFSEVLKAGGL